MKIRSITREMTIVIEKLADIERSTDITEISYNVEKMRVSLVRVTSAVRSLGEIAAKRQEAARINKEAILKINEELKSKEDIKFHKLQEGFEEGEIS